MHHRLTIWLSAVLLSLLVSVPAQARNASWANDTTRNKVREARNVPVELTEANLVWEIETGTKNQYPMGTIVGDKVLVGSGMVAHEDPFWEEALSKGGALTCRNLSDGKLIWRMVAPDHTRPGGFGVCSPPVIDGNRVYIMSAFDVVCVDLNGLADGNQGMTDELELMTRRPFELPEGAEMPTEIPEWAADVLWYHHFGDRGIMVQDATSATPLLVDNQIWIATANEMGVEARGKKHHKEDYIMEVVPHPRILVLDAEDGSLIAEDRLPTPIVWHGEWSSCSLLEVNGKRAVLFGDGYGLLHGLGIPEPSPDGKPVILDTYWTVDLNPPEWRFDDQGRRKMYKGDTRLDYKYPPDWPDDETKWCPLKERDDFTENPAEIIAMPVVVDNLVYIGLGRDWNYTGGYVPEHRDITENATRAFRRFGGGRFMCLEFSDVTKPPRMLWEDRDVARTQSNASVKDGLVYLADLSGFLNCWNAKTGEVVYKYDIGASVKERSQLVTDGKIYVSNDRNELMILSEGPDPQLLGEARFRQHQATVEPADGLLLIVTHKNISLYKSQETALSRNP